MPMILSQKNLEEMAAAVTKDFNRLFFGAEAEKQNRFALPTPIDQLASRYSRTMSAIFMRQPLRLLR